MFSDLPGSSNRADKQSYKHKTNTSAAAQGVKIKYTGDQCKQLIVFDTESSNVTDVLLLEVSGHSYPEGQLMQAVWFPTEYVPSWQGIWVFLLVIGQALKKKL